MTAPTLRTKLRDATVLAAAVASYLVLGSLGLLVINWTAEPMVITTDESMRVYLWFRWLERMAALIPAALTFGSVAGLSTFSPKHIVMGFTVFALGTVGVLWSLWLSGIVESSTLERMGSPSIVAQQTMTILLQVALVGTGAALAKSIQSAEAGLAKSRRKRVWCWAVLSVSLVLAIFALVVVFAGIDAR